MKPSAFVTGRHPRDMTSTDLLKNPQARTPNVQGGGGGGGGTTRTAFRFDGFHKPPKELKDMLSKENAEKAFNDLMEFRGEAKMFLKHLGRFCDHCASLAYETEMMSTAMQRIAKSAPRESVINKYTTYFATSTRCVASLQEEMAEQIKFVGEKLVSLFVDFDFVEANEWKRRIDHPVDEKEKMKAFLLRASQKERSDDPKLWSNFGNAVAGIQDKTESHLLFAMLQEMLVCREYFNKGQKIFENMGKKYTELQKHLMENVESKGIVDGVVYQKNGKKMYLSLVNGYIKYIESDKEFSEDNLIDVTIASARVPIEVEKDEKRFRFEVHTPKRKTPLVMFTDTPEEREFWVSSIQSAVTKKLSRSSVRLSRRFLSSVVALNELTTDRSHASYNLEETTFVKTSQPIGDKNARSLGTQNINIIRTFCGNSVCCECGAKNPEWVSINLGVVFCLRCSGIHRSLGTHITKVRGLSLDRWTAFLLLLFRYWGNSNCNAVFEAKATEADKDPENIAEFVKKKYVEKAYLDYEMLDMKSSDTLLHEAVRNEDSLESLKGVMTALAFGANPNMVYTTMENRTPLHEAVRMGNLASVVALVVNGASIFATDVRGWSPIHYAAFFNRPRIFIFICQNMRRGDELKGIDPFAIAKENLSNEVANLGSRTKRTAMMFTFEDALVDEHCLYDHASEPKRTDLPSIGASDEPQWSAMSHVDDLFDILNLDDEFSETTVILNLSQDDMSPEFEGDVSGLGRTQVLFAGSREIVAADEGESEEKALKSRPSKSVLQPVLIPKRHFTDDEIEARKAKYAGLRFQMDTLIDFVMSFSKMCSNETMNQIKNDPEYMMMTKQQEYIARQQEQVEIKINDRNESSPERLEALRAQFEQLGEQRMSGENMMKVFVQKTYSRVQEDMRLKVKTDSAQIREDLDACEKDLREMEIDPYSLVPEKVLEVNEETFVQVNAYDFAEGVVSGKKPESTPVNPAVLKTARPNDAYSLLQQIESSIIAGMQAPRQTSVHGFPEAPKPKPSQRRLEVALPAARKASVVSPRDRALSAPMPAPPAQKLVQRVPPQVPSGPKPPRPQRPQRSPLPPPAGKAVLQKPVIIPQ